MTKPRIELNENPDGSLGMLVPPELAPLFRKLVVRAMMTWQEPHPAIRNFADSLSGLSKVLPTELAGCQDATEGKVQ